MGFDGSIEDGEMEAGLGSVDVESVFIGLGCNRVVGAVDWGPCNLVAFGAHNAVAIFSPDEAKILVTLPGHKDYVNCVLWLPTSLQIDAGAQWSGLMVASAVRSSCEEHFLLSGSADGTIVLWGYLATENKWRKAADIPKAHDKAVTCIATVMLSPSSALMSTTSSDTSFRIWNVCLPAQSTGGCQISLLQTIDVGSRAMVATSLTALPDSQDAYLLALGGLDNQVHFYAGSSKGQFVLVCKVKAHIDWVRSLDFRVPDLGSTKAVVYLASSSQDKTIKIWKVARRESLAADSNGGGSSLKLELSLKTFIDGPVFKVGDAIWQVSLESLLLGHEDWVYSVRWQPHASGHVAVHSDSGDGDRQDGETMCVLSASMDRTMMIWKPSTESGIWMNEVTVGELSHSALGFYGGVWGPPGDAILAHGYGGSLHLWKEVESQEWEPQLTPSGHSAPVVDLAWSKTNQFLISASNDQTARVFACWNRNNEENAKEGLSWYEIGRPQVHGHDLNCLAIVTGTGNHRYVSGADEKVARVFEAPGAFLDTLAFTVGGKVTLEDGLVREDVKILGANMSALGLSQKPIYSQGKGSDSAAVKNFDDEAGLNTMDSLPEALPSVLTKPPFEEHLCQNTLWPETHKLYGHGNELYAMCCDHSGKLLATACKAQSANFAQIWLWQVNLWRPIDQLKSHVLTVTQMEFSHNDRFLLSVSRDRHLSVFERVNTDDEGYTSSPYKLVTRVDGHKRIIWACSWSHCDSFFATGSRDKVVKIWAVQDTDTGVQVHNTMTLPPFKISVTALAWGPKLPHQKAYLLAVGMEDGSVELWQGSLKRASESDFNIVVGDGPTSLWKLEMSCLEKFDKVLCHVATVQRLTWKAHLSGHERNTSPEISSNVVDSSSSKQPVDEVLQLASCGADHSVRLFNLKLG